MAGPSKHYLDDSVYAQFQHGMLRLFTWNGGEEGPEIWLEPKVWLELARLVASRHEAAAND